MQLNLFGFENIKKCSDCKKVLTINKYYKNKYSKNGFDYRCKECRKKIYKIYYNINRQKMINNAIRYYNNHKDKINKQRKNSKQSASYYRNRRKNDITYRLKKNISNSFRKSLTKKGYTKKSKTHQILGIDWDTFKKHIENQFIDNMSWDNFNKIHIDHKIPIAAASTEFEVIALNHYTNLQPLWAEDNVRKSDKYDPEDFKKYMDWYTKNIKAYPEK